jgi:hypothetical protein
MSEKELACELGTLSSRATRNTVKEPLWERIVGVRCVYQQEILLTVIHTLQPLYRGIWAEICPFAA